MSLLINGMNMPEHGIHHGAIVIYETGNHLVVNSHPYNKCFALYVIPTPHGRLIDADKLYDLIETQYKFSSGKEHTIYRDILDLICSTETVIEAEDER